MDQNTALEKLNTATGAERSISAVLSMRVRLFVILFLLLMAAIMFLLEKRSADKQTDARILGALEEAENIAEGFFTDNLYGTIRRVVDDLDEKRPEGDLNEALNVYTAEYDVLEVAHVIDSRGTVLYSTNGDIIGQKIASEKEAEAWIQKVFDKANGLRFLKLGTLVPDLFGKEYEYVCYCFQSDHYLAPKGSVLLVGNFGQFISKRINNRLSVYVRNATFSTDGSFLLLKEDNKNPGSYIVFGGKDIIPELYRTGDEVYDTVSFPAEQHAPKESFTCSYKGRGYRCMYAKRKDSLIVAMVPQRSIVASIIFNILVIVLLLAVLFMILGRALQTKLSTLIVVPIQRLYDSVNHISAGNLDVKVDVRENISFAMLTDNINIMVLFLKRYIREAAGRIDQELAHARSIQFSAVPRTFPAYPDRNEFDIYASMEPSKEVGGDFYDFFFVDDDHLALVIGDVSGKGVPAALFMMRARASIYDHAMRGGTPAEILYNVNNSLYQNNSERLFVTVWLAVIDLSIGQGLESNAGHVHPAFCRNEEYRLVRYHHSPPVATLPDLQFSDRKFSLESGDKIFVYTDGVTGAVNEDNKRFGEDALAEALNEQVNKKPKDLIEGVRARIDSFTGKATQSDDMTMCAFTYLGKEDQ